MADAATYTFLPWVRQGIASAITTPDNASAQGHVTLTVGLLADRQTVTVPIRVYGPGDVRGIDRRLVVKTDPPDGTTDFESNYLAAIEFQRPDFPWLLTPVAAGERRLRPWICLVVVPQRPGISLTVDSPLPLPVLHVDRASELPDLADVWATAHVQVASRPGDSIGDLIKSGSNQAVARLLCFRKLEHGTKYLACVVPTFDAGRKTGLGQNLTADDENTLKLAWAQDGSNIDLPVYVHWEFATQAGGDFESLVRALEHEAPTVSNDVGQQPMDVSAPGYGLLSAGSPLGLLGALQPRGFTPTDWSSVVRSPFQDALRTLINLPTEPTQVPLVAPPIYGAWYANAPNVPAPTSSAAWFPELNLDPRHRAAASLGTAVVQNHQEQLMAAAWDSLAHLRHANQALRQAQFARSVGSAVLKGHLEGVSGGAILQVTRPVHARILGSATTLAYDITSSAIPNGAVSPTFRRLTSPEAPLARRLLADRGPMPAFVDRLNGAITVAPPRAKPHGTVLVKDVTQVATGYSNVQYEAASEAALKVALGWMLTRPHPTNPEGERAARAANPRQVDWQQSHMDSRIPAPPSFEDLTQGNFNEMKRDFEAAARRLQGYLQQALTLADQEPINPPLASHHQAVLDRLDPHNTVLASVQKRLELEPAVWQRQDPLDPLVEAPEFTQSMYHPLAELSQRFILPGVEKVPADTIVIMEPDHRFIEAYLIGLNHAMGRELLWREFPTSRRATYFRNFWSDPQNANADIPEIGTWNAALALGDNSKAWSTAPLLIVIRSSFLRRYPNTSIYVEEASASRRPNGNVSQPLFRGDLDPDLAFIGFNLDLTTVVGDPGWFLVIEQHPQQPRFGLRADDGKYENPGTWAGLSWSNLSANAEGLAALKYASMIWPRGTDLTLQVNALPGAATASWGHSSDSAQMASICLRNPVRVAIHASALLPKQA